MDTISRESNTNQYLPIAGLLVGLVAAVFAVVAIYKVSSVSKALAAASEKIDKIDAVQSAVDSAAADIQTVKKDMARQNTAIQDDFNQISSKFASIDASITKLQEAAKPVAKPAKASKAGPAAEASTPGTVSSEGTYTIKSGDNLAKVARANGVSLADLEAANPGVDPKKLKVGQKINLPAKQP